MNLTCHECSSVFRVDPAKVPAAGVRARCSVCGGIIAVERPERVTVAASSGNDEPPEPRGHLALEPPPPVDRAELRAVVADEGPETSRQLDDASLGGEAPTGTGDDSTRAAGRSEPASPSLVGRQAASHGHHASPDASPAPESRVESAPDLRSAGDVAPSRPSMSDPPRPPSQPRVAPRRVNPYLANDPAQKARRLARALVSDLVAYHPEKREEGLRAGTLKELFREDIQKSWQEYVEQVGAPTAEGTPYFQDALNDILAGGRRVF